MVMQGKRRLLEGKRIPIISIIRNVRSPNSERSIRSTDSIQFPSAFELSSFFIMYGGAVVFDVGASVSVSKGFGVAGSSKLCFDFEALFEFWGDCFLKLFFPF